MRTLPTWAAVLVAVFLVGVAPIAGTAPASGDTASSPAAVPEPNPQVAQQGACSFPVTATDATGSEVTVEDEPERIVVLAPSDAQTLWAIGAQGTVVGLPINQYTSYLNGTDGKTNVVNDDGSVNTEQVVGLEPDLVLTANVTPEATVTQLREAGLTVYSTDVATSIEDIYAVTEEYGRLAGECEGANATVAEMRERVSAVEDAVAGTDRPRVLYYFFEYTAGTGTHIHDVIETAGGRNVAAAAGIQGYQPISDEVVAQRDPEWIVTPSDAQLPRGAPYDGTTALQENRTVELESNYISQPGPYVVIALERLARALHPEAFGETETTAGATATETERPVAADGGENATAAATDGGETGTTTTGEAGENGTTTEASGPGFGLAGAVVAFLLAVVLARRR